MINYDMLVDSMSQVLFEDVHTKEWNEDQAKVTSRKLLEMVETYKSIKPVRWRASD